MGNNNSQPDLKIEKKEEVFEKKEEVNAMGSIKCELFQDFTPTQCQVYSYEENNIWSVSNLLSAEECQELISQSESFGFVDALLSVGTRQIMRKDVRDNKRVIWDDIAFASQLYERVKHFVPEDCTIIEPVRGKDFKVSGCNERLRFYRYEAEERFRPHLDGCFSKKTETTQETSFLTCIVYLNDVNDGGETNFFKGIEVNYAVKPTLGSCLFFRHAGNLHEGAAISKDSTEKKYVLRTDIMYKKNL
ncbi:prolyl 4-hydroxylase [Acrasis kona]|uniref:Prolyl 4-hydroxylase n=1 Tax=Acrasis kona TaxID=1008807 RepID=A0AAW2Z082_9EUKA